MRKTDYDVLVVGGGPAGLTAALTLGRGNRTVLLCDSGHPRNAPAGHMHNFPTNEGTPPLEFRRKVQTELLQYPHVQHRELAVLSVEKMQDHFIAKFSDETTLRFRKVLIAVGVRDELPDIPGIKDLWGKSVFHCPYCHGYEFKNKRFALIGGLDFLMHMGPLVKGLTQDAVFFTNGPVSLSEKEQDLLKRNSIQLYQDKIERLEFEGEQVQNIVLGQGEKVSCDAVLVRTVMKPQSDLGDQLGCQKTEMGLYVVDNLKRSTVPGVSMAGDITEMMQSVLMACQAGQVAGAGLNFDLLHEDWESASLER